jgi:hypothetical protein
MGKPAKRIRASGFPALDTFTYNNTPLSLTTPILSECKTPLERTIWIVDQLRVWEQNNLQTFLASNKVGGKYSIVLTTQDDSLTYYGV